MRTIKKGDCPNCGTTHHLPPIRRGPYDRDVVLVRFGNGKQELWCTHCRNALAPEETSFFTRSVFGTTAQKRQAQAGLRRMEKRIRRFIAERESPDTIGD